MPATAQRQSRPRTVIIAVPGSAILYRRVEGGLKRLEEQLLQIPYTENLVVQRSLVAFFELNTTPRAGQVFEITSINYSFPEASRALPEGGKPGNVKFKLRVFKGSAKIGEQTVIEYDSESAPFRATGTVEPFFSNTLFPGESLSFELVMESDIRTPALILNLGSGNVFVNYNLITR